MSFYEPLNPIQRAFYLSMTIVAWIFFWPILALIDAPPALRNTRKPDLGCGVAIFQPVWIVFLCGVIAWLYRIVTP